MKTLNLVLACLAGFTLFSSCDTLNSIAQSASTVLNDSSSSSTYTPSSLDMSNGLKSALEVGIVNGSNNLAQTNGYFGNALLKIVMPLEAKQVETTLRDLGMGKLVDDAILSFNRGAEKAAKEAAPIFINSIKQMTFADAKNILLSGDKTSATAFLKKTSYASLQQVFTPIIDNSLKSVNATKYWGDVINNYNKLPAVKKVNPDLTAYVTEQALNGLFKMVEKEEIKIRDNINARTTDIMQKVFGWADKQK